MANYSTSNQSTAQAKLLGAFQNAELRYAPPVTFLKIKESAPFLYENFELLRTREDRAITAYYKKRNAVSLTAAFTHDHTGSYGDSGSMALTWTPYTREFALSLKQGDNNLFNNQEQLNTEFQNTAIDLAISAESAATNFLFNNKSGVNAASVRGRFNTDKDVYEIEAADLGTSMLISTVVMAVNKYGTNATVYCDSNSFVDMKYNAAQGAQNATNLSFQFAGINFVHSMNLTALAATEGYTKGFWIIVPDGTVGVLPWIPKQNRDGVVTQVAKYSTFTNPITGLDYGLHTYETRADNSANNGYVQDVVTQYQAGIYLSFDKAPLSVAGETTIYAFGIVSQLSV